VPGQTLPRADLVTRSGAWRRSIEAIDREARWATGRATRSSAARTTRRKRPPAGPRETSRSRRPQSASGSPSPTSRRSRAAPPTGPRATRIQRRRPPRSPRRTRNATRSNARPAASSEPPAPLVSHLMTAAAPEVTSAESSWTWRWPAGSGVGAGPPWRRHPRNQVVQLRCRRDGSGPARADTGRVATAELDFRGCCVATAELDSRGCCVATGELDSADVRCDRGT